MYYTTRTQRALPPCLIFILIHYIFTDAARAGVPVPPALCFQVARALPAVCFQAARALPAVRFQVARAFPAVRFQAAVRFQVARALSRRVFPARPKAVPSGNGKAALPLEPRLRPGRFGLPENVRRYPRPACSAAGIWKWQRATTMGLAGSDCQASTATLAMRLPWRVRAQRA